MPKTRLHPGFPQHSPFFPPKPFMNFSRYSGRRMLAHHILLSSAAVVSPYAFPSLHKAVFFTCFPVDKRELNHIASFVCGNLESFEVHAIPEVYKNVSFLCYEILK